MGKESVTRGGTGGLTSDFNYILVNTQVLNTYSPGMASSISSLQPTEGIGHGTIRGESDSEQQRCAPFGMLTSL